MDARWKRVAGRIVASLVVAALAGAAAAVAARAPDAGAWESRPAQVKDDLADRPLFELEASKPGATTRCVTLRGIRARAVVRLVARASGTGLDRFLRVTVTRGRGPFGDRGCDRFIADRRDRGHGPGVLFRGTLTQLARMAPWGVVDDAPAARSERTYRLTAVLPSDDRAQGRTASVELSIHH